ncbi:catecholate siderophore receptor [Pseudomonas sp. TE3786]
MSATSTESTVFSPRLLATAVGVAMSAAPLAHAAEALTLETTKVVGEQDQPDSYKVDESASKKYTAPLRETPKSVTVISDQVIKDTGSLSLADALRTTSGITFGAGEGGNPAGDRPIIRGFNAESDVFIDGLRDVASQTREVFNLEQVEVSKGPGSAFTGAGSTGGSLNLISKSAKQQDFADAGFTYGSDQTRRYTLDVNRVLTDNIAARINLMQHDANVAGRAGADVSRWGVAPTVTFGFNTPTRATLSYYHVEGEDTPDLGNPLQSAVGSDGVRTPAGNKDKFYGFSSRDYRDSSTDTGTFKIEHDLNDNITLSNSSRIVRTTLDYIATNPDDSRGNVDRGYVSRSAKSRNSTSEGLINQTDLSARFDTGFIEHSLNTGVEFSKEGVHNRNYFVTPGVAGTTCNAAGLNSHDCTSLADPNYNDTFTGTIADSKAYTDTDSKTLSAYVFDTLKFNEQWSLNAGLRYDDYQTESQGLTASATNVVSGSFDNENNSHFWNYQLGLVFNPLPNGSIYVAWSTSSNPVGETSGEGTDAIAVGTQALEPERNRNYEVGTKWDFFDERLGVNAAVFRTEKTNARVSDEDGLTQNIGETRVDGFELGVSGKITEKWQVFANYTYLDGEIVDGGVINTAGRGAPAVYVKGLYDGNDIPSVPENSASFWTTYQVLPKLTLGAGAYYVDSRFGNTANTVQVPDYWRYDAMAKYVVSKNLDLQLNVQNLTDERYYDQVYSTHMAHVAAGRTALLSTNFHF